VWPYGPPMKPKWPRQSSSTVSHGPEDDSVSLGTWKPFLFCARLHMMGIQETFWSEGLWVARNLRLVQTLERLQGFAVNGESSLYDPIVV